MCVRLPSVRASVTIAARVVSCCAPRVVSNKNVLHTRRDRTNAAATNAASQNVCDQAADVWNPRTYNGIQAVLDGRRSSNRWPHNGDGTKANDNDIDNDDIGDNIENDIVAVVAVLVGAGGESIKPEYK